MHIRLATTAAIASLALAACATQPKPLQGQYDAISPQDVAAGGHAGAHVRWGGRIIRTEPGPNRTCFEVISTRLDGSGQPLRRSDETGGRFIACRAGFYDPAVFAPEREVTFTGRIDGTESRKVEDYDYTFPRLAADVVYLWPQRTQVDPMYRSSWGMYGPRPWGWRVGWGWGW